MADDDKKNDDKKDDDREDELEAGRMPLLDHLIELRGRLIWSFAAIIVGFIACYQFKVPIYDFLARPLADAFAVVGNTKFKVHVT